MTLPIRQIKGAGKCYLSLEGTVLLLHQKQAGTEQTVLIPVELVSISERSLLRGSHLIAALLFLLVPLLAGGISIGIASSVFGEDSPYLAITSCTFPIILLAGLVLFFVFLVKFFRKDKTVCLNIAPEGLKVEFWRPKKHSQQTDQFIKQLTEKQSLVNESLLYTARSALGFTDVHSVLPKMFAAVFLFISPALITGKPLLLLLGVLPIGWFVYKKLIYSTQPKEYRRAIRHYLHRQWDDAISILSQLLEQQSDYIPAYELLAHIYTRTGRFDEALRTAARLPDGYEELVHSMQTGIWKFKRIYERCKEPVTDDNKPATNELARNQGTQ